MTKENVKTKDDRTFIMRKSLDYPGGGDILLIA